jgi:hypothetical protein
MTDARAAIHAMFPLDEVATAELDLRLDALDAESLRGFIHHLEYSAGDSAAEKLLEDAPALAALLAGEKATAPAATAALDFYQVGHTYTEPDGITDWKFRVDSITTHPEDGERTAIGWRRFRGEWDVYAYGEDDFEIHQHVGYIDTTEAGDRRG